MGSKWLILTTVAVTLFTLGCRMDSSSAQAEAVPAISTTTVYTATPPPMVVTTPVATPTPAAAVMTAEAPEAPVAAANNAEPTLPSDLSPGLADIIKLVEAKVGDEVVLNYIKGSGVTYHPTAAEIVYLNDLGVSDAVINAILQPANPGAVAATPTPAPEPVAVPVAEPALFQFLQWYTAEQCAVGSSSHTLQY